MTDELVESGLLETWRWELDDKADNLVDADLLIVRPSAFGGAKTFRFVRRFGSTGAGFLGAHRISLYRAGPLYQAARAASSEERAR
jgi:hypothetical protein